MDIENQRTKCRALVHKYYAGVPTREELLHAAIQEILQPQSRLLDAGCGDQLPFLKKYWQKVALAVGVDLVTPSSKKDCDAAVVRGDLGRLPIRDSSFDVVISHSVFEHIEKPEIVFRELNRALRRDGRLIFTTPNKFYYSCVIARLIPFALKDWFMKKVFDEDSYDHFPVFYRANTVAAFKKLGARAGFDVVKVTPIRHYPFYLMFSPLLFRAGMVYDWIITKCRLHFLQSNWLVVMEKRGALP